MPYEPTLPSLNAHRVPDWYEDAKFGIFIHWGLFSIPAFAAKSGSIAEAFRNQYDYAVAQTPYCEWYWNAIKVPESDSAKHHADVYKNAPYENFREPFLRGLAHWRPTNGPRTSRTPARSTSCSSPSIMTASVCGRVR